MEVVPLRCTYCGRLIEYCPRMKLRGWQGLTVNDVHQAMFNCLNATQGRVFRVIETADRLMAVSNVSTVVCDGHGTGDHSVRCIAERNYALACGREWDE